MKRLIHIFFMLMAATLLLSCKGDMHSLLKLPKIAAMPTDYAEIGDMQEDDCGNFKSSELNAQNQNGDVPTPCTCEGQLSNSYNSIDSSESKKAYQPFLLGGIPCALADAVHSFRYISFGGLVLSSTKPVYSIASRTYYIYVLRHIIR